jgi:hypothetical protein
MASRVKRRDGPPGIEKPIQQKQGEKLEEEEEEEDIAQNIEEEQHTKGQYIDKKPRKQRKQNPKQKDIPVDCKGRRKRKVTKSRKEKDKKGRTSKFTVQSGCLLNKIQLLWTILPGSPPRKTKRARLSQN